MTAQRGKESKGGGVPELLHELCSLYAGKNKGMQVNCSQGGNVCTFYIPNIAHCMRVCWREGRKGVMVFRKLHVLLDWPLPALFTFPSGPIL